MLFVLTGDVQTGKTRWLHDLVEEIASRGVLCEGVLAPGCGASEPLGRWRSFRRVRLRARARRRAWGAHLPTRSSA